MDLGDLRKCDTAPLLATSCGQGSTAPFGTLRLLFFHHANEILERGSCDDAIELGPVVVDHANVFDHKVVDFPLFVDAVEFVVDGQFLAVVCDDLCVHYRIVCVLDLTRVEDGLTGIVFNILRVRSAQQPGENLYEFPLFRGGAASPVRPQGALGHFRKVEPGRNDFSQLGP